jgi:creatinine amidohydrolase
MTVVEWGAAPWTAVGEALRENPLILLGVGAMEAHGPHLSNDTDTVIADAVVRRAAELLSEAGEPVLVLPALPYGVCQAARPFPGTIDLAPDLLVALLTAICQEVARHGGRRFVLSAHHWDPKHLDALDVAVERILDIDGASCAVLDRRSIDADEFRRRFHEGDGSVTLRHGGRLETAMVLSAAPEHAPGGGRLEPVWVDLMAEFARGATNFVEAGAEMAYFGDPSSATAGEGRDAIEWLARSLFDLALTTPRPPA